MKYFIRLFVLIVFMQISAGAQGFTPHLPIQDTDQYRNANKYQQDFLYLCDGLIDFHANVFHQFTKEDFLREKEVVLRKLASCNSDSVFLLVTQQFVLNIRDIHTGLKGAPVIGWGRNLPFRTAYIGDALVIINTTNQIAENICNDTLASINGISVDSIFTLAGQLVQYENYVNLRNTVMLSVYNTGFLKSANIIETDSDKVIITTTGGKTIDMQMISNDQWKLKFPPHPVTVKLNQPFSYKIIKEKSLCYIQMTSMVDREQYNKLLQLIPWYKRWLVKTMMFFGYTANGNLPDQYFYEFLNTCIADIKKNNIKKVFVDLRTNKGGNANLGTLMMYAFGIDSCLGFSADVRRSALLKMQFEAMGINLPSAKQKDSSSSPYMLTKYAEGADEITDRIKPKVYLAVGRWTYSSAVMFATIAKDNKVFTVIGSPTPQIPSHFGEVLFLKLPNSGSNVSLSSKFFHRPDKALDSEPVLTPDVLIQTTFQSLVDGVDPVYEYVINND